MPVSAASGRRKAEIHGTLSGSTVLLTMTVDVPLFGCPKKKKKTDVAVSLIESVWAKLDDVQFSWIRLLHLAWFWRVESSSRAAPTQPMTQQLIDSQTVRGKDSDMTAFKFSCQLLAV